jgi:hypothetical protein
MSKVAYADIVVLRSELRVPGRKFRIRVDLYNALADLGRVESVDRYVQDPPDGPFHDGTFEEPDADRYAVIRIIGRVEPVGQSTKAASHAH